MKLLRRVLELHGRNKFEIVLFCHTEQKYLARSRHGRSLTQWGDVCIVRDMTDEEAAKAIRERQIDILVDLKGHTFGGRSRILNYGGAPLQATWLGFPGSVTDVDLDYAIGDRFVLPRTSEVHYHESWCACRRATSPTTRQSSEAEADNPGPSRIAGDAFVFASFNAQTADHYRDIDVLVQHPQARAKRRALADAFVAPHPDKPAQLHQ